MNPNQLGEKIYKELGKYVDRANHEVSVLGQKYAWFKAVSVVSNNLNEMSNMLKYRSI